jgi:hypothetical protein
MRHLKMLGLAAIAALVAMALVGASSASATGLFKNSGHTEAYAKGQTYTATSSSAVLDTNEEDVTCVTSGAVPGSKTVLEQSENNTGAGMALKGKILSLEFKNCTSSGGISCTVTSVNTPYNASVSFTSGSNGTITVTGASGEPGARVSCGFGFLQCRFGAEPKLGITGGNPAKVTATAVPMKLTSEEGFAKCPAEAKWTATYTATSPTAIFVGA